jgi:phosphomannomutase
MCLSPKSIKELLSLMANRDLKNSEPYLHQFHPTILREYDIRGIYEETLLDQDAYWIGRCFGHCIKVKGGKAVAVCRDGRLSSPQLKEALIKGLCESGLDVYDLGIGPTPMLYFAEYDLPVDGAIMVTGSHNPPNHNGFKMSLMRKPFFGKDIKAFSQLLAENLSQGTGKVFEKDICFSYVQRLLQGLEFDKKLTIAWDPGHGATVDVLKHLISSLPGRHIVLNDTIDGTFPAHSPDPSDSKNLTQLRQVVLEESCDLGIAFDGDGDRLVAIDEKGNVFCGDQLLLVFANDLLKRNPKATVIADVKASQGLFDEIERLGGNPLMWKTGHSHIKSKMAESGALLAGEMSGHFFLKEGYYGFDDGMYAAVHLVHLLSHCPQSLAQFYEGFPSLCSTPEIKIPCENKRKFEIPEDIKARLKSQGLSYIDIDGVRVQLKDGWWLLRASNTQDVLVARCEASTPEGLEKVKQHLQDELTEAKVTFQV